jgi:hypothetical protein
MASSTSERLSPSREAINSAAKPWRESSATRSVRGRAGEEASSPAGGGVPEAAAVAAGA